MHNYRRDFRDLDTFKADIFRSHLVQKWAIEAFEAEIKHRGYLIQIKDNGVANDGRFVSKATAEADYLVEIYQGDFLSSFELEVKVAPHYIKYFTIKEDSLIRLVADSAYCLIVAGINTKAASREEIDFREARWVLISPETSTRLLATLPVFQNKYFNGGKKSVQILAKDFPAWFVLNRFEHLN